MTGPLKVYILKLWGNPVSMHRTKEDAEKAGYKLDEVTHADYEDDDSVKYYCRFSIEEYVEGNLADREFWEYEYEIKGYDS